MKKVILASLLAILNLAANAHCCVRCVPDNTPSGVSCWLSNSPCEKQPDGTGGCHCADGNCSQPTCSCDALAVGPGGSVAGAPISINQTDFVPLIDNNNNLSVKNLATDAVIFVMNLNGLIDNQLFRFEAVQGQNQIVMKRMTITEDMNGNITSQIPNTDIVLSISM